jgi:hypothetical protein
MPLTDRSQAKEGGLKQVREALTAFEGDVVAQDARDNKTEWGQWGTMVGDDGKPRPPKEYLQIACVNVVPREFTEELSMDISEGWNIRINTSEYKGSFWVDAFLLSAEKAKVIVPEGMIGKRILFKKFTLQAVNKDGTPNPKFDSTNFVIDKVIGEAGAYVPPSAPVQSQTATTAQPATTVPASQPATNSTDPMDIAMDIAVGKTEQQFRTAIALNPAFANSPLLSLAKAGAVTQTLVTEGKLKLVVQGNKSVYMKV